MKIKITADSSCDLSPELLQQHHISIIPISVVKDGISYSDGFDISPEDIFAHVSAGGSLCSTAAANVASYEDYFRNYLEGYDALVHINIGSSFSSCYQNASLAAEAFSNVFVVDSRNLSTGQGHVVLEACKYAESGMRPEQLLSALNEFIPRVDASFLLDHLDYMVKGGRCSTVAALGANLLHLKPCIEVAGGAMHVGRKYRGSYIKCICEYVRDRLANLNDLDPERIFVTYTAKINPEIVAAVVQEVRKVCHFEVIEQTVAGSTISCHCGPDTLGILYIHKKT